VQIKWIRDNEKDIFDNTYKFLSTLDFINYKLTGNYVIDTTNAGITQLMNLQEERWDGELLQMAGITEDRLPYILETGAEVGRLTAEAAEELGLGTTIRIINGGHDQYCAALGSGALNEGDILLSSGTAWVILGITSRPFLDTRTYIGSGRHIIKGLWGILASISTGGVAKEWFRDNFALNVKSDGKDNIESFEDIDKEAAGLMEKTAGLFFYPYFNGSGVPHRDNKLKACFLGLGLEHDRYSMARAIMEGLAFELKEIIEYFESIGNRMDSLILLGGASRSLLWTEIISNVLGVRIARLEEADAACIGAAIIAGVGCGMFANYHDGFNSVFSKSSYVYPDRYMSSFYEEKHSKYKKGFEFLKNYYSSL
jgi:sugar (pentulose or hexulose) kinase